ncbi:ATP-dependent helicase [Terracoccus luteus]|uniref:DNA 3'-5' helicase n=1 Tax=Terracoccus luteus TaxID=53356 RepID=A0A839PYJ3_9MICO|nr:ATP-dependent DNA helicase [Terracoccus luteus]MBB2985842.1 superfamily I DNA/RNA helicase/RecB family exonuclease [Terracoccus luteus]MCP2171494.1 superfamily I DNA/RNA helicase/RecB family exonuclease [Terracoccus luteus]
MVILRRAPAPAPADVRLDERQREALASRARVLRVLGGPGTGKSTLAVELVVDAVRHRGLRADSCLVLTASRTAAAALRQRVTARLDGTSTESLARTWQAFGFGVLRAEAALHGDPAPRLLGGPEQDVILRDLLAGHASGDVPGPSWPEGLREALPTRGFRNELRDLLMRAVEHGLGPDDLAALGREHDRPEWVAAAHVLREYDDVTSFSRYGSYDPAWVLTAAAELLEDDPLALDRLRERVRLVVVDDAQEATSAAARLLRVLVRGGGPRVVLVGDPDLAVQTFRGADPRFLASGWTELADPPRGPRPAEQLALFAPDLETAPEPPPEAVSETDAGQPRRAREARAEGDAGIEPPGIRTVVLTESHRLGPALAGVADRVTRRIGALGGGEQRRLVAAAPRPDRCRVDVALLRSAAQETAHVAAVLRRAHLVEGVPWSDMAVVVRGSSRADTMRRLLGQAGVPVEAGSAEAPVRDEAAVRPLLHLLDEAIAVVRAGHERRDHAVDPVRAADLLLSPVGGCDTVALRRLRRRLRHDELADGGGRSSDELLAALLLEPARAAVLGPVARPAARIASALAAGAAAARLDDDGRWAAGVTAETVLWALWQGAGVGETWRRTALAGGSSGERADRDLDAVLALFDAAGAFVDRLPTAGPDTFLEHVQGQDVPGDTLLVGAQAGGRVALVTPQTAAGRQWHIVVVAGVQEGVWPDLRLRGSVLGSEDLVDVVAQRPLGFRAAQAAVRYDETRLFHVAVTRATERLLVTAVGDEDEQPSVYLDLVDPPERTRLADEVRPHTEVARTMTLPGLVGELRRDVTSPDPGVAEPALALLATAARAGVRGAHPASWWALREPSSHDPVRAPGDPVPVSPSKVTYFGECGLRWFLTTVGGEGVQLGAASVGTFVHDIVAELPDEPRERLSAEVDARWGRLGLSPGWVTDRTRREAHDMVARFVAYREAAERERARVGIETDFRVTVGRAVVAGRVDRIEREADGALRIVDLKTGTSKPTRADLAEHGQLGTYQVAVEEGGFADLGTHSAGASLVFIGKGGLANLQPAVLSQDAVSEAPDPAWARDLVETTAEGMAAATFTASHGTCRTCPVKASCPVQPEGDAL